MPDPSPDASSDRAPEREPALVSTKVLLVSGSLREGSTNTALLRTVAQIAPPAIAAALYDGMGVLPHFDPDLDRAPLPAEVARLRTAIHSSDALLFSTPEYAGALPGSFKNLLDWTIGDDVVGSIYQKPVAYINTSAAPNGAADAHESLRKVLGYAHAAVIDEACAAIPVPRAAVRDGQIDDTAIRDAIIHALRRLVDGANRT